MKMKAKLWSFICPELDCKEKPFGSDQVVASDESSVLLMRVFMLWQLCKEQTQLCISQSMIQIGKNTSMHDSLTLTF